MHIYIIGNDGITLCREPPGAVNEGEIVVASNEELHAARLSGKRLLALWNALPDVEKRKKVGDREALIDQLWSAIEALPEPEPQPDPKRPSKRDAVIAMLRRPEGATVDEVASAFHERANEGRTVIEKVEAHGDVGFAIVLLTPDDEGSLKGGTPAPRARQNVLLELGYFIGRLGRNRVCALKRGDLEIPSDFGGVVYEPFDAAGAWKQKLGRELEAVGYEIDWNKVMRA